MSDPTRRCRCRECEKDARAAPPATEDQRAGKSSPCVCGHDAGSHDKCRGYCRSKCPCRCKEYRPATEDRGAPGWPSVMVSGGFAAPRLPCACGEWVPGEFKDGTHHVSRGACVTAPRAAKEPATRLPPPLSEEARKAREPLPPHALLAAESVPILPTPGRAGTPIPLPRAAKEDPGEALAVENARLMERVCELQRLLHSADLAARVTLDHVRALVASEARSLSPAPAAPLAPTDACDVCKTLRPHGYLVPAGDGWMICPSCAPAPEASPAPCCPGWNGFGTEGGQGKDDHIQVVHTHPGFIDAIVRDFIDEREREWVIYFTDPRTNSTAQTTARLRAFPDMRRAAPRAAKEESREALLKYDHLAGRVLFFCAATGDGQTPEQAIESHFASDPRRHAEPLTDRELASVRSLAAAPLPGDGREP